MSIMFHPRLLIALVVSLVIAAFPAFTYATHSWNNYHWARASNPFTLQLGDNVGDTNQLSLWAGYLTRASDHWSNSPQTWPHVLNTVVAGCETQRLLLQQFEVPEVQQPCLEKSGNLPGSRPYLRSRPPG